MTRCGLEMGTTVAVFHILGKKLLSRISFNSSKNKMFYDDMYDNIFDVFDK